MRKVVSFFSCAEEMSSGSMDVSEILLSRFTSLFQILLGVTQCANKTWWEGHLHLEIREQSFSNPRYYIAQQNLLA